MGVVLPGGAAARQDEEDQVGEEDLFAGEKEGHFSEAGTGLTEQAGGRLL